MISLSIEQVRLLRLASQQLVPVSNVSLTSVTQLISHLCSVQAQELPAAHLAIRARSQGLTTADVQKVREVSRSIVMTWVMRGTLHLVATDDMDWLSMLFGQAFISKAERRYRELGLDADTRSRATELMHTTLQQKGALTRKEIANMLEAKGVPVAGQAIAYLVRHAALAGAICFGNMHDKELTYVAFDRWVKIDPGKQVNPEQAIAKLVQRYLQAYQPATLEDCVRWSGLSVKQIRDGFQVLRDKLVEVDLGGSVGYVLKDNLDLLEQSYSEPIVRLLPRFDTFLLGYASRDFIVKPTYAKRINAGGGQIHATVIVNGEAIATWRMKRSKNTLTILVEPFEGMDAEIISYVQAEAQDIGRFLGIEMQLEIQ